MFVTCGGFRGHLRGSELGLPPQDPVPGGLGLRTYGSRSYRSLTLIKCVTLSSPSLMYLGDSCPGFPNCGKVTSEFYSYVLVVFC